AQIEKAQNVSLSQGLDLQMERNQILRLEDARIFWQLNNYVKNTTRISEGMLNREMVFPVPNIDQIGKKGVFQNININGNSYLLYERPLVYGNTIVGLLQLAADTNAENRIM